jgi:hypothetical protein
VAKIERTALIEGRVSTRVSLSLSSDGSLLLVLTRAGEAKFVRTSDLAVERTLKLEADTGTLRWFDGGRRLLGITPSHSIAVFDAQSGETLLALRAPDSIGALACDSDGRRIAAGFDSGTMRVWSSDSAAQGNEARRAVNKASELARPYVARLLDEQHLSPEAALDAIRKDESISEGLRTAATRFVELTRGEKMFLRHECWETCRSSKTEAAERDLALWRALALEAQDPDDERAAFLEAAARYRLGQFERASELLKRSGELRGTARVPVDAQGMQALVLWKLGRTEEALAELARMRASMRRTRCRPRARRTKSSCAKSKPCCAPRPERRSREDFAVAVPFAHAVDLGARAGDVDGAAAHRIELVVVQRAGDVFALDQRPVDDASAFVRTTAIDGVELAAHAREDDLGAARQRIAERDALRLSLLDLPAPWINAGLPRNRPNSFENMRADRNGARHLFIAAPPVRRRL